MWWDVDNLAADKDAIGMWTTFQPRASISNDNPGRTKPDPLLPDNVGGAGGAKD